MATAKSEKTEATSEPLVNETAEYLGIDDARDLSVPGNDLGGYIGVSPEYMNYADETHRPFSTPEEVIPTVEQLEFDYTDSASEDPGQGGESAKASESDKSSSAAK